jgi:hypothetical protein
MRSEIGVVCLMAMLGCGTVLRVTDEPLSPETLAQYRRGAEALQCRERKSAEFELFVVCPPKQQSFGLSSTNGKVTLTCAELFPRPCRRLEQRLLEAARSASDESP